MCGSRTGMATGAEDVAIIIPFPRCVQTVNVKVTTGKIVFDELTKVRD